jgi:prepilin-type N-terminal cleavage/methylation domain-containing protein
MKELPFSNSKGFSLIEILVAGALISVVSMAMMTMMKSQETQVQRINQKMEVNDIKNQLQTLFTSSAACLCQFAPSQTFNSTDASGHQFITLDKIKLDCASSILLQVDQKTETGLVVDKIQFADLRPTSPTQWLGNWTVYFKNSALAEFKPMKLGQIVTIDNSVPSAARITSCTGSGQSYRQVSIVAIPNFPLNGTQTVDFKSFLPAADQPNVTAIQVSIENYTDVVPTNDIAADVTFLIDGAQMFHFYYDTSGNNERWQIQNQSLVSAGSHTIRMTTLRTNPINFTFRITGYFMK